MLQTFTSLARYCVRSPKAGPPLRACLTITDVCNLRCKSCAIWKRKKSGDELTRDELFGLVDQCIAMGVRIFYLFGGEPLLHPDFLDLVSYIHEKQCFSETVTNGTLLTPKKVEAILDSGLDKIWVSIDAPAQIHDELRGVDGTFDRALQGIDNLLAAKEQRNSPILVDLAVTISSLNYRQLPALLETMRGRDLYEINIRHMGVFFPEDIANLEEVVAEPMGQKLPDNAACFTEGDSILLSVEQATEFQQILCDAMALELGIPLHIEPDLLHVVDWRKGKKVSSCLHLWTQLTINARGDVTPCLWYDTLSFGNVRQASLDELWNGRVAQHMRRHFRELTCCSKCCYFYLTLGQNIKRAFQVANFPFRRLLGVKG